MAGYLAENKVYKGQPQVIGASATAVPVSSEFRISELGSRAIRIEVEVSGTAGAPVLTFQDSTVEGVWNTVKTSVAADGVVGMRVLDLVDTTLCPLRSKGRVVITTAGGEAATVEAVFVTQGQ